MQKRESIERKIYEKQDKNTNFLSFSEISLGNTTHISTGDTIIHSGAKPAGKIYGVSVFKMYNVDKEAMMYCTGHDLR